MNPAGGTLLGPWIDGRRLLQNGAISLLVHVAAISWLVVGPSLFGGRAFMGPVYTVDLVGGLGAPAPVAGSPDEIGPAAPAKGSEAETAKEEGTAQEEVAVAKTPPPPRKAAVKEKTPPADLIPVGKDEKAKSEPEPLPKIGTPKESSKIKESKEKNKPEEKIDQALSRLEQKVGKKTAEAEKKGKADAAASHLAQALDRARQKVASGAFGMGPGQGLGGMGGGSGFGYGGTGSGSDRFSIYYTQVWNRVRSNWTLPAEWAGSKLEAIIIIGVRQNGEIAQIKFEKRSGNDKFDQSAHWAVERSNPLPPLPQGMSGPTEIGIRFRPEE